MNFVSFRNMYKHQRKRHLNSFGVYDYYSIILVIAVIDSRKS